MKIKVRGSEIRDFTTRAPPSKSYTHRAYAVAALAEGTSVIENPLRAGDTDSTLAACRAFGVKVSERDDGVEIEGSGGRLKTPAEPIYVGNSGTTIRFFTAIAALDGKVTLTGDSSILKRPMLPLLDALKGLGVTAVSQRGDGRPPVEVRGGSFTGGRTHIRGDVSSQFISALLIASPYAESPVTIELTTPLKSRPYVDVTLDVMKGFGVDVDAAGYSAFTISPGTYRGRRYAVEGDYSSASYLLALAALSRSTVTVKNLPEGSAQGDRAILELLGEMGCDVERRPGSVTVRGAPLHGIEADLGDTPDLLPTVAALACRAEGMTAIRNIGHARYKETDRLSACAKEFRRFGAEIEEKKDSLVIYGRERLKGAKVNSYGDHRMAMALTVLGAVAEGETILSDAESVDISFPGFYDILREAGVEVEAIG
ncbi:MAG: 3-phosphoshikimate 1-carboxyvinyltransferase [Methanobacteriota archaeon]|nr:MAG: 3-phosphoshikimate 1-carboxyvinyltransferase [Euryarchaeota archaeon]